MNVSLTPELERFVQEKVHSGRYTSASEVVREALRLLEEHEKVRAARRVPRGDRAAAGVLRAWGRHRWGDGPGAASPTVARPTAIARMTLYILDARVC